MTPSLSGRTAVIDLSIVIVTWNTRELVLECLASVEREVRALEGSCGLSVETWVVDNGSEDGTAEAIAERIGRVFYSDSA